MIIPSAQIEEKRRLFPVDTDESGSESDNEVVNAENSDKDMVEEIEVEESDLSKPRRILQSTWDSLSPLTKEEDLIGKWYGVTSVEKEQHGLHWQNLATFHDG